MSRLPRPSISVETRCRVALRQLGEAWIDDVIRANRFVPRIIPSRSLGKLLDRLLDRLAELLACPREQLHLDHDPALENREKVFDRDGKHVDYKPVASDPEWLFYRPFGPEFTGSHKIKTLVRGDHGAYSDAALARKNKRIAKKRAPASDSRPKFRSPKRKWPSRPFPKGRGFNGRKK